MCVAGSLPHHIVMAYRPHTACTSCRSRSPLGGTTWTVNPVDGLKPSPCLESIVHGLEAVWIVAEITRVRPFDSRVGITVEAFKFIRVNWSRHGTDHISSNSEQGYALLPSRHLDRGLCMWRLLRHRGSTGEKCLMTDMDMAIDRRHLLGVLIKIPVFSLLDGLQALFHADYRRACPFECRLSLFQ